MYVYIGGAETFSDVPIRFSKPIRKRLLGLSKAAKKGIPGYLGLLKGLKLGDLAPEAPAIANYTTGEVMVGYSKYGGVTSLSCSFSCYAPISSSFFDYL